MAVLVVSDFSYSLIDIMYAPGGCRHCQLPPGPA